MALYNDIEQLKFCGQEFWRTSSYQVTLLVTFMLTMQVGIIELDQNRVKEFIRDWLDMILRLQESKQCCQISLSVISKLLLKQDYNISSMARDVMLKPLLYSNSFHDINDLIIEWSTILMETYKGIKEGSTVMNPKGELQQEKS